MKNLMLVFFCLFTASTLLGQSTCKTESSKRSFSISLDTDKLEKCKYSSLSISNTNNCYEMEAKFKNIETDQLASILNNAIEVSPTKQNKKQVWEKKINGKSIYNFELNKKSLKVKIDKSVLNDTECGELMAVCESLANTFNSED